MPDRNVMFGLIALIAIGFVALVVGGALQWADSKDMAGIAAAVTVTFVIWFTVVVMALGTALWPLLAGVH
jgi:hypothetical protein